MLLGTCGEGTETFSFTSLLDILDIQLIFSFHKNRIAQLHKNNLLLLLLFFLSKR